MTPYRIPLFEEMQNHVSDLTVLLMAGHEENREWNLEDFKFKAEVLPGCHIKPPGFEVAIHLNHGVIRKLVQINPDIVLSGGFATANVLAWAYCRFFRKQYFGWGEITLRNPKEKGLIRKLIRKTVTRFSRGAIASTSEAREAFLNYGAKEKSTLLSIMPVHVDWFKEKADRLRNSGDYPELKRRFTGPILLSVGRFVNYKGFKELFGIYKDLLKYFPEATLILAGDGPEKSLYEEFARMENLKNIFFTGFLQKEELVKYYVISDLFIFPTLHDTFGAVISEALSCETPVVSSIYAAATRDLIFDHYNGFRFDPTNRIIAVNVIRGFLNLGSSKREEMAKAGYMTVRQFDIRNSAKSMIEFMRAKLSEAA